MTKRTKRTKPTVTERYATIILDLRRVDGTPLVDRETAKHLTSAEIVEQFEAKIEFDHGVYVAFSGTNHPTNLTPRTIADHKAKTSKDITAIAKAKRIEKQHQEFRSRILAKSGLADDGSIMDTAPKTKNMHGRLMAGTKASGLRKKMNGTVERRTVK